MKNCCLWINGKKISDINGIKENFNISDVRGYFCGGRLADWLSAHDAEREAELVRRIPTGVNPDKFLQDIFCKKEEATPPAIIYHKQTVRLGYVNGNSSFNVDSSFNKGSFSGSYSFRTGSFGSFRYQFEFERSSFSVTSFNITSFKIGSFNFGSFSLTALMKNGSFCYDDFVNIQRLKEKALLTYFTSEPLNKYGYGIHLI